MREIGRFRNTDPETAMQAACQVSNRKINEKINFVKTFFRERNEEGGYTVSDMVDEFLRRSRNDLTYDGTYGNIPNYKAVSNNIYSALHKLATSPSQDGVILIRLMGVRDEEDNLVLDKLGKYKIRAKASNVAKKQQMYVWFTHRDALPAYEKRSVSSLRYVIPNREIQSTFILEEQEPAIA